MLEQIKICVTHSNQCNSQNCLFKTRKFYILAQSLLIYFLFGVKQYQCLAFTLNNANNLNSFCNKNHLCYMKVAQEPLILPRNSIITFNPKLMTLPLRVLPFVCISKMILIYKNFLLNISYRKNNLIDNSRTFETQSGFKLEMHKKSLQYWMRATRMGHEY